jgi:hypothetical protein
LLNLAAALEARSVPYYLRIAGSGPEEAGLRERGDELAALTGRRSIEFLGRVPHSDMAAVWQATDVCLLVSNYEGTSVAMLEAMANGSVPVVTDVSGTKAVVAHGENGFTFPVGANGWRVGGLFTANRLSHPKIPNYVLQNIPRDPGDTYGYNLGVGAGRLDGPTTLFVDIIIEPMRSETAHAGTPGGRQPLRQREGSRSSRLPAAS